MKVLIIEDEKTAIRNLKNILSAHTPEVEVIGVLEGIEDTIEWFTVNPAPDLIFLDIHLSDGSCFEIFEHIHINCPIIFTTAYDEYALKAFKVNSIDYLLKPIQANDIIKALDKLKALKNSENRKDDNSNGNNIQKLIQTFFKQGTYRTHFLISIKGDKFVPLDISTVLYFYILDGIVYGVTTDENKIVIPHTLDEIDETVNPFQFFRINRQYIIARNAIKELSTWFTGRLAVTLTIPTEEKIIISRQKVSDFKEWITGNFK